MYICRRLYCVLIFHFHFVVVYLIYFYMWLRILRSWKVTLYSDRDNIIIIIIIVGFLGLRFKLVLLVLLWLHWYFVGCIGRNTNATNKIPMQPM